MGRLPFVKNEATQKLIIDSKDSFESQRLGCLSKRVQISPYSPTAVKFGVNENQALRAVQECSGKGLNGGS